MSEEFAYRFPLLIGQVKEDFSRNSCTDYAYLGASSFNNSLSESTLLHGSDGRATARSVFSLVGLRRYINRSFPFLS